MSKTYREFLIASGVSAEELNKVTEPWLDEATIQCDNPSASDVLKCAFLWDEAPQGHNFWLKIYQSLYFMERLNA